MNEMYLPPLPPIGTSGTAVCTTIRLYLAVWSDLTPEQMETVAHHVRTCPPCAEEEHLLRQATQVIAHMEESSPSEHVNQAIIAAIAAKSHDKRNAQVLPFRPHRLQQRGTRRFALASAIVAAALLLVALATFHFTGSSPKTQQAFVLPATLTWTDYVLYQMETHTNKQGDVYHIISYYDLQQQRLNVETHMLDGSLDVVMVGDERTHQALGLDMMHHVAQWNAQAWAIDESMFNLNALRDELRVQRAIYWGKQLFQNQQVYVIHCDNNLVMLLDMHYMPINILSGATKIGTGQPIYNILKWMQPTEVSPARWAMSVPSNFQMGTLPAKP